MSVAQPIVSDMIAQAMLGEFERYWTHQLSRVKDRAEKKAATRAWVSDSNSPNKEDK